MIEGFTEPMSYKEAREFIVEEPQFYKEYKRLGGKLSKGDYTKVASMFVWFTEEAYVDGFWLFHGDRKNSWAMFARWLSQHCPDEKADTIYQSIDNVHAYT